MTTQQIHPSSCENAEPIDVLMSPGPRQLKENPSLLLLFEEVAKHRVKIGEFSSKSSMLKRHDIIHIHWPEWLVRWSSLPKASFDIVTLLGLLWIARRRGARVVWTGHNLEPHQITRRKLWAVFQKLFISQTDLLVSFGKGATELLWQRYPRLRNTPTAIIPHGHYRDYYLASPETDKFRNQMGLDDRPTFLCFGLIKDYKNIPNLVKAWKRLPMPRPQLVVAGRPVRDELEAEIRQETNDADDVHLLLRFISDDDVPTVFAAANVLLMPYEPRSALNSGAAHLALSMGKPAVLNDTPANRDLQEAFGQDWVYLCDGTADGALRVAEKAAAMSRPAAPDFHAIDYPKLGIQMREAYRQAIASRKDG